MSFYYAARDEGRLLSGSYNKFQVPYELIFDYRKNPTSDWGTYTYSGDFHFPPELEAWRAALVGLFKNKGFLYKGDHICPRINNVFPGKDQLSIEIQRATYFDQVATNLSLDYPLNDSLAKSLHARTVREWDLRQSGPIQGGIPPLSRSKLANTIGVALGITTTNAMGEKVILIRRRTSHVAVSQNRLVLPFSFSLNLNEHICNPGDSGSISDLIKTDFRQEQKEELGLDPEVLDFEKIKPVAFCRELCRGGKPQFFFRLETDIKLGDLQGLVKESSTINKEFRGPLMGLTMDKAFKDMNRFSPELNAFIATES